mgnify:FL=1
MAYTAATGFRYFKSLSGATAAPVPIPVRIANSTTLRVGDLVRVNTSGLVVTAGVGNPVAGVLAGFIDQSGVNPFSLGYSGGGITKTGDDTLATSSTNTTRADYINAEVIVDVEGDLLWYNDADADQAQTNIFQYFDIDSVSRQVTQSTASDANGQLQLILWDPKGVSNVPGNVAAADASQGAYRIAENQFGIGIDSATAKNAA